MIRKLLAFAATATLAVGSLALVAAPADAAPKTVYTQCINYSGNGEKLTKKTLATAYMIQCWDLADLSALKDAKNMAVLSLESNSTLKIKGTSKLRGIPLYQLYINAKVSDPTFAFLKDLPRLQRFDAGTASATSLASVSKLKNLEVLSLSTSSALSFKPLAKLGKLYEINLRVNAGKADLDSLAKLPKLSSLRLSGKFTQSVAPLEKSTALRNLTVSKETKKKLTKGQKHVLPPAMESYTLDRKAGWKTPAGSRPTVASNGVGVVKFGDHWTTKLGKIEVDHYPTHVFYTPGKINFQAPAIKKKTARPGTTVRAAAISDSDDWWEPWVSYCSYQWQRDKKNIKGATKSIYKVSKADINKTLRLRTTCLPSTQLGSAYGFTTNTKYSGAVKIKK